MFHFSSFLHPIIRSSLYVSLVFFRSNSNLKSLRDAWHQTPHLIGFAWKHYIDSPPRFPPLPKQAGTISRRDCNSAHPSTHRQARYISISSQITFRPTFVGSRQYVNGARFHSRRRRSASRRAALLLFP